MNLNGLRFGYLAAFVLVVGVASCSSNESNVGSLPPGAGGGSGTGGANSTAGGAGSNVAGNGGTGAGDGGSNTAGSSGSSDGKIVCGTRLLGKHTGCEPQVAHSSGGACECIIGVRWDGSSCVGVSGCECTGADCLNMYPSADECTAAHASCSSDGGKQILCGAAVMGVHAGCEPMAAEGDEECYCAIGYKWNGSKCINVGGCKCIGPDCPNIYKTQEACQQAHSTCGADGGATVLACGTKVVGVHDNCLPQEATGQGACFCLVGYRWDGSSCVDVSGCECVGRDCPNIFDKKEACDTAHSSCQ